MKRAGLRACRPRKTPLLKHVHLIAIRLDFAKCHILFGHNRVSSVYRQSGEDFLHKNIIITVNHSGGSLIVGDPLLSLNQDDL